ncbi:hypothetical protein [Sphaerisporangium siamense]|uniref:Zinc-binding dehydrogenase n=1 Tax=Sphaerisporangium siamense TaxID=795645 RepID=A0A7W7G9M9_9ACTN|nr:hypothetical protein [Sphaerisporangium siamense]MBB4701527.1 hypothetical protein [Sphaerisporangium siamense]
MISLATVGELGEAAGWINRRLSGGGLRLSTHLLPLSEAREAHRATEAAVRGEGGGPHGRLVLRIPAA